MFVLTVENFKGERLQLTQNPDYNVIEVNGLDPPKANINTATNATFDGSVYKSAKVVERNIVLKVVIEGNIEQNRLNLYKYMPTKKNVVLYIKNGSRDVFIAGYVESFEINIFNQKQVAQVSILCPKSYFSDLAEGSYDMSSVVSLFHFPFESPVNVGFEFSRIELMQEVTIYNYGEVVTGLTIEFRAHGTVVNPTFYNVETGEKIQVNITLSAGEALIIDTAKGNKSIMLISDGVEYNRLNALDLSSKWLQLEIGDNVFLYTADSGADNCECFVFFNVLYEGV